jgi:hypothetical protein
MPAPTDRTSFKEYCLRRLGKGVVQINVSDDQVEDRIDDALEYFQDYHSDATTRSYIKHQVTQAEIDQEYITLNDSVKNVIRVLSIDAATASSSMFDVRYQMHLNDVFDFTSVNVSEFTTMRSHLSMLDDLFNGITPIRHERHTDKLRIDFSWKDNLNDGDYIIIEAFQILDPTVNTQIWNDRFLKEYATAQIKEQWGMNVSKYEGIQLPGGVTMNGRAILEEAKQEIAELEEQMQLMHELPVDFMTG